MPKIQLSQFVANVIREARDDELADMRTSSVMSTKFDNWRCPKCGARNPEWAERCQACDRQR